MVDEVKETQNDGEKPQEETGEENNYILSDEAYKVLKWLALSRCPLWLCSCMWSAPHGTFHALTRS